MSTTAIIFLCIHCFCAGGFFFGLITENEEGACAAAFCWALMILVNVTRYLVLL